MNRLQKKCFIAATGFHLLLALILLVGPAFLSRKENADDVRTIEFVPWITTDANASGGGDPKGSTPPPQTQPQPTPPAPKPVVVPPPSPDPQPPVETKPEKPAKPEPDDSKPDPDSLEPSKSKKREIKVNTNLVVRNNDAQKQAKARAEAERKRIAAQNQKIAAAFGGAASSLQRNLSGSTTITFKGPGGGGLPYANFRDALMTIYKNAWDVPQGITDDSLSVKAEVTIARDGSVVNTRIIRRSGNEPVDQSVEDVLRRVRFAVPLPPGAKEDQRTVGIIFDVKAKLIG